MDVFHMPQGLTTVTRRDASVQISMNLNPPCQVKQGYRSDRWYCCSKFQSGFQFCFAGPLVYSGSSRQCQISSHCRFPNCVMSSLAHLPDEVLKLVLKHVPLKHRLSSCCLVSRRLHA
jgi:hypothetical protein